MHKTRGEKAFQIVDIILMAIILAVVIFPILNVLSLSVSSREAILNNEVTIYPIGFNFDAYIDVMENSQFNRSLINNVGLTIVGTFLAVLVTLMVSFALTKDFLGKKIINYYFILTMYFSGGLVPTYIIVATVLDLRNTYWVLILPSLVSVFYIIVMRSQIETMPTEVFEASYIDGANEFQTVFLVVLPMISPTIAAIAMFFALSFWNMWYNVMIYIDYDKHWTLQYFLRVVVFEKFLSQYSSTSLTVEFDEMIPEENFRNAAVVMVAAPIVAIYPFVQKYFVKGIISGAVKG